jgi:hypothetical protein
MAVVSLVAATASLLVVSGYGGHWWGGHSWGSRFMTEALVVATPVAAAALVVVLAGARHRFPIAAVAALIGFSVFVHGVGALTTAAGNWNTVPTNVDDDPRRVWSWTDPPFLRLSTPDEGARPTWPVPGGGHPAVVSR